MVSRLPSLLPPSGCCEVARDGTSERLPVTYAYRLNDLLSLLGTKTEEKATALAATVRRVEHGLLSVGLKIHCLDDSAKFNNLIEALGGSSRILEVNQFKDARASSAWCCRRSGVRPRQFI